MLGKGRIRAFVLALVVCELENTDSEKAVITDNGGQAYGKEACYQLSGEGRLRPR